MIINIGYDLIYFIINIVYQISHIFKKKKYKKFIYTY